MGCPIKQLELREEQRSELAKGYCEGKSHGYRQRCQMMLLKSEKRSSAEVAEILGCCEVVVNSWMRRYEAEGIQGLHTKPGRGRKSILSEAEDDAKIKVVVQENRQRLSVAKAELEEALEKSFSQKTLERYIKNVLVAINASEFEVTNPATTNPQMIPRDLSPRNVLANSPVVKRMLINVKP